MLYIWTCRKGICIKLFAELCFVFLKINFYFLVLCVRLGTKVEKPLLLRCVDIIENQNLYLDNWANKYN